MYQRLPLPQLTLHVCRFGGFDDEDELDAAEGLEDEEGQVRVVALGEHQPLRCAWFGVGGGGMGGRGGGGGELRGCTATTLRRSVRSHQAPG